jgi:nucleoside-diphosphate-sugar epimerase
MNEHTSNTVLVTGALGCIGAWVVAHLMQQGDHVISFDLDDRGHRLDLLLTAEEQSSIAFVRGDLSDPTHVLDVFKAYPITHVIHLAALQVPLCKADPIRCAQVNVAGTVNVFEAARQTGVRHVAYASSIAVYGPPDLYPPGLVPGDATLAPRTLYGVFKQANEGMARVYWEDYGLSSVALRPYTVYGVGRDQGLTSDPTKAMLAAAADRPFHIAFGGWFQLQLASDVALQFIQAARSPLEGAHAFNLGGEVTSVGEIIELIRRVKPDAAITYDDKPLQFPPGLDDRDLHEHAEPVYHTPLADGVQQTIEHFERLLAAGRLRIT